MLKVISWNVNSIKMRLERAKALLKAESPDILCLQELKCIDEAFPEGFAELGYHASIFGQKAFNGVAILSKKVPQKVMKGISTSDPDSRLISATFDDVTVYSAYVPNGQAVDSEKYAYKLSWFERFQAELKKRHEKKEAVLICGDFNVAPEDRDVHDPIQWKDQILCSKKERLGLKQILSAGFFDTYRKLYPDKQEFSWWDYRGIAFPLNHGLRIDFVLASDSLAEKCVGAGILRNERKGEKPSDHAPVFAEFNIP